MKLYLNSKGINTKVGAKQILESINQYDLPSKTIFIVSHPAYEIDEIIEKSCINMSFSCENIFFSKDGIPDFIPDFVYVSEGNTFDIMQYMRTNKIDVYVKDICEKGTIYIGSSAGAIIASENIKVAMLSDQNDVRMYDYSGLGLFKGIIVPHCKEEQLEQYISFMGQEYIDQFEKIYCVDDESVVWVDE